jgi:Zn-dependent protease
MADLPERLIRLIVMLLSLTVHEWAHASVAVSLGDDTPERQGRHTLNPIPHIDIVGTILMPLFNMPFGWAKPVQWNPSRVRRGISMRRASWMVSIAGPLSNVVLALVAAVALFLTYRFPIDQAVFPVEALARIFVQTNVGLAVFNMLPIPPLDGSRIVDANITPSMEAGWATVHRYAPFILLLVIMLPPVKDVLYIPMDYLTRLIANLAANMVGV